MSILSNQQSVCKPHLLAANGVHKGQRIIARKHARRLSNIRVLYLLAVELPSWQRRTANVIL